MTAATSLAATPGVLQGIALLLLAAFIFVGAEYRPTVEPRGGATAGLPVDILALGTEVRPIGPDGMIEQGLALAVARREYPEIFNQGRIESFLVALTDPMLPGFEDRPVWVIKASGLALDIFSAPMLPDGRPADPGVATTAYIYVDGVTGEWLTAHFEGSEPN